MYVQSMTIAESKKAVEAGKALGTLTIRHKIRTLSNYHEDDTRAYCDKPLFIIKNIPAEEIAAVLATCKTLNPHLRDVTSSWSAYDLTP